MTTSTLGRRLTAQLLAGAPARDPLTVVRKLLAVQGQDPRGARLAIRARTTGLRATDVDRALGERELLITWSNRGTLHLVCSEDYPWLHALTTPQLVTSSTTRLAQEGIDAAATERGLRAIIGALGEEGPLTREQLRERVQAAGVPNAGQGLIQLLFRAAIGGKIVRGPMIGRQHAYVLVADWLPRSEPVDRDIALAELARRYLVGHAPADDRDLARWAGLPLRDARAALSAISGELRQRGDGLVELRSARRAAPTPPPRLLGTFEPVLLGWRSRAEILGDNERQIVNGGMFSGFAMVGGRGVARWKLDGKRVSIEPFDDVSDDDMAALARDGEAVVEYLGR